MGILTLFIIFFTVGLIQGLILKKILPHLEDKRIIYLSLPVILVLTWALSPNFLIILVGILIAEFGAAAGADTTRSHFSGHPV